MVAVENGTHAHTQKHTLKSTHINNNGILAVPLLKPHQLQQIF
jgi:hypothetical protein